MKTIFHAPFIWIKKKSKEANIVEKLTKDRCMCCNCTNGRVEFENGGLKKSSFIIKVIKDKTKGCRLTRTKLLAKSQK
jgi:hypothetical protein